MKKNTLIKATIIYTGYEKDNLQTNLNMLQSRLNSVFRFMEIKTNNNISTQRKAKEKGYSISTIEN